MHQHPVACHNRAGVPEPSCCEILEIVKSLLKIVKILLKILEILLISCSRRLDDREGQALALRCAGIFACARTIARDRPSRYGKRVIFVCGLPIARDRPSRYGVRRIFVCARAVARDRPSRYGAREIFGTRGILYKKIHKKI